VIIIDPSFRPVALRDIINTAKIQSPDSRLVILSLDDQPEIVRAILASDAQTVVLKRRVATELYAALDAIELGETYASPDFGLVPPGSSQACSSL
jgi:DNA-binding NarL/FixJ family response regulator